MSIENLKDWIGYWHRANMVNFREINSIEDARLAIKYCQCLRTGSAATLSAEDLHAAISELRAEEFEF